jgi:Spy/CpxP family protein refolding chaperone
MKPPVIAGVLGAALFLVVACAMAQPLAPPDGPPMHGPMGMHGPMAMHGPAGPAMMARHMAEELDRALDRASVTPEQRVKIYEARDRARAALTAQRPDPWAMRDQMLAAFEGAQLTQAQLDTLHQAQEQRMRAMRTAIDRAILDVHATLTPAQRKIVAEHFRTHPMMPGHAAQRFGPPDGPGGPMGGSQGPGPR